MIRRLTFCDACAQLGISEEDVYDDSTGEEEEEEVGEVENALLELQTDEEEKTAVDDEGDVAVFFEGESDSSDDEGESVDRESDDEQADDWVVSPSGISYTSKPLPARKGKGILLQRLREQLLNLRARKKVLNVCSVKKFSKLSFFPQTESFFPQTQRNLHQVHYPTNMFSMDELTASIAIMLRAGCDRDNFIDLIDLLKPSDSRPFYRTVMSLNRIKLLLRCIRFDNWHTREQRKIDDKFAAVSEIWEIFLRNARCIYIPGDCITVDEQLVGYRGRIPG